MNATHTVQFENAENGAHNALPLGNGRLGAMAFFADGALRIALNHYDCYYQSVEPHPLPERSYAELCRVVEASRQNAGFSRTHYVRTLQNGGANGLPLYSGVSHPYAGELVLRLSDDLQDADASLRLIIEDAQVRFTARGEKKSLKILVWAAVDADCVIIETESSEAGLVRSAALEYPSAQGLPGFQVGDSPEDGGLSKTATVISNGKTFSTETAVRIPGSVYIDGELQLGGCGRAFAAAASVRPKRGEAFRECARAVNELAALRISHGAHWRKYWRSGVTLPDKLLETLWFLHVYLTGCDNGAGGAYYEQARGLNGLWDIRRPSLWGSRWYWDVNIQQAFWHTLSANHLEQAKAFCDAYLRHVEDMERYTREVYGLDGIAADYPHPLYNCIQPWCAVFLWEYYERCGNRDFLGEQAYPVFLKLARFIGQIAKPDKTGVLHFDPDISPEQGPASRDSVATIAAIKRLLICTGKAAQILERPQDERKEIERMLRALPDYPLTADKSRFKDSACAPDDLPLRHPSILMPIYPMNELHARSPEPVRKRALNTLRFATEHTEYGTFGFGWLAAAAARLGEGSAALRILYEQGVDLSMRTNGLFYEESDRWLNHCVVTKPPLHLPAMCEAGGGLVAAVNEILLQARDGVIELFPATPNGVDNLRGPRYHYIEDEDLAAREFERHEWKSCAFSGLLAPGGFEISAQLVGGKTVWLSVTATQGGELRLRLPESLSESGREAVLTLLMRPGETKAWGKKRCDEQTKPASPMSTTAENTGRRVFLGEDADTEYYKAIDGFAGAFTFTNTVLPVWLPYIFDFGGDTGKDCVEDFAPALCRWDGHVFKCTGPRIVGVDIYSPEKGYGFANIVGMRTASGNGCGGLRGNFVTGDNKNEFWLELPRGRYDLLVISGGGDTLALPQYGTTAGGRLKNDFQCVTLPVSHMSDGILKIAIGGEDKAWKLAAIFVAKQRAYL